MVFGPTQASYETHGASSMQTTPPSRHVLFPTPYVWCVFFAAMDIMVTWIVLHMGGREVNGVAAWLIHRFGLWGIVVFKFVIIMAVIAICEFIGRRRPVLGKRLAEWAVALNVVPVAVGLVQLVFKTVQASA